MDATPALILAAGGVGLGHAVLPDHWVPLAVVGRTRGYPLARVARLSALAGVAHVLVSLILGGAILLVGLPLRHAVEHVQNLVVGTLLILTGVGFAALELSGRGHGHSHDHDADHDHDAHPPGGALRSRRAASLAGIMVPFGAAASPDLTILPVFLAATTAGAGAAAGALIAFAGITILTIVTLTVLSAAGGYGLRSRWLDVWGNAFTAAVLIVIGTLVVMGVL